MSEKRKLDQVAAGGSNPGPNAANTTVASVVEQQPGAATQAKQVPPHSEDAHRRAEMRKALVAEVNSRSPGVGTNPDQGQAPPPVTKAKVETGVNLPPDEGKAGRGDVTPTPAVSVSPAPASGHDRRQAPGDRARAYRARAMRDQAHAERYGGWTDTYAKGVQKRRARSRKLAEQSFESKMLADGVELSDSLTEKHRNLGYTIPKLGELLQVAGQLEVDFDTLIVILRSLLTEKLRALGYTLPKIGELLLVARQLEVDVDTLIMALRGIKASKG